MSAVVENNNYYVYLDVIQPSLPQVHGIVMILWGELIQFYKQRKPFRKWSWNLIMVS